MGTTEYPARQHWVVGGSESCHLERTPNDTGKKTRAPFTENVRRAAAALRDQKRIGITRIATMFTTLIIGLIAGPDVSL